MQTGTSLAIRDRGCDGTEQAPPTPEAAAAASAFGTLVIVPGKESRKVHQSTYWLYTHS